MKPNFFIFSLFIILLHFLFLNFFIFLFFHFFHFFFFVSVEICSYSVHALQVSQGQRKHNMVAELLFWFTSVIMASAEDMRALLERIGGMERALIEQQVRADQKTTAL